MLNQNPIQQNCVVFTCSRLLHNFIFQEIELNVGINCKIIVETNFRVYIEIIGSEEGQDPSLPLQPLRRERPQSEFQGRVNDVKKLVQDFLDIEVVFPHLIVANITESQINQAFQNEITSKLIISFFEKCASKERLQYVKEKQTQQNLDILAIQKEKLSFLKIYQE